MSLFRSMFSSNFSVNEKGETTFYFPVLAGRWSLRKGVRVTSDEDVERLKRLLGLHFAILLFVLAPPLLFIGTRLLELNTTARSAAYVLFCLAVAVLYSLAFDRLCISRVVGKYERTDEKLDFAAHRQRLQSHTWRSLCLLGLMNLLLLAGGLYAVISRLWAALGIVLLVVFAITGTQLAYRVVLKLRAGGSAGSE